MLLLKIIYKVIDHRNDYKNDYKVIDCRNDYTRQLITKIITKQLITEMNDKVIDWKNDCMIIESEKWLQSTIDCTGRLCALLTVFPSTYAAHIRVSLSSLHRASILN